MLDFDRLDRAWLAARPGAKWRRHGPGVIPAWVADMDFPTPAVVARSLHALVDGADLGYPDWPDGSPLRAAFAQRMGSRYGWSAEGERVREMTDVVQGVQVALHLGSSPGDGVVVATPAYPPFFSSVEELGRRLVADPLHTTDDGHRIDLDGLAARIERTGARAMILCNPHNPTGRCFTEAELRSVAELAVAHDLLVVSDEIHADLVHAPHRHVPIASLGADIAARTVTVTSATKAFNLAGIRCAVAHVGPDHVLDAIDATPHLWGGVSPLATTATLAAWSDEGTEWLDALLLHLDRNRRLLAELLAEHVPSARYRPPEATYLAWLDLRDTGLGPDPAAVILDRAGVALGSGPDFGPEGEGFARLNLATSAEILVEIVERIGRAAASWVA